MARLELEPGTALLLGLSAPAPAKRPPNIVLVMMDDLWYGDLASYGASDVRTPNVDRLAREGVRLTDAYANGPVCTPTRAALISGRYPQRDGLEWAVTISPEERCLPRVVAGGAAVAAEALRLNTGS